MNMTRICMAEALACCVALAARAGESESGSGTRTPGRILLEDTSPSEILFKSPDQSVQYTRGEVVANRLLGFVSEYGELGPAPPVQYEPNANVLLLFVDLFEAGIHQDPFYLFGRDLAPGKFPYQEQAWNALGGALRRKYQIVLAADQAIKRVQAATTFSYHTTAGSTFKIRPAIEDIMSADKIRIRVGWLGLGIVDRIESKIGTKDVRVAIVKKAMIRGRLSEIQMIYEGRDLDGETASYEDLEELTLSVPFW